MFGLLVLYGLQHKFLIPVQFSAFNIYVYFINDHVLVELMHIIGDQTPDKILVS